MGSFRSTSRCVLCLAGTSALLILIDSISEVVLYSRVPNGFARLIGVVIGCIIALSIPYCGWQGVRDRNDGMLCLFSHFSYAIGCLDCLAFCLCCALVVVGVGFTHLAQSCDETAQPNDVCDDDLKNKLYDTCEEFSIHFKKAVLNSTLTSEEASQVAAEMNDRLSEQKCIDTLAGWGFVLAAAGVILAVTRCFLLCLHCASGHYGGKVRTLLDEDPRAVGSDSDSD